MKNRQDNSLIDEFKALSLPIFTLNEFKEIKKFISRRYHVSYYTSKMAVSDEKAFEFEKKYNPRYSESSLIVLRHLVGHLLTSSFNIWKQTHMNYMN